MGHQPKYKRKPYVMVVLTWAMYNRSLFVVIIMLVSLVGTRLYRVFQRKH